MVNLVKLTQDSNSTHLQLHELYCGEYKALNVVFKF